VSDLKKNDEHHSPWCFMSHDLTSGETAAMEDDLEVALALSLGRGGAEDEDEEIQRALFMSQQNSNS